jgi:hypothetical protein
VNCGEVARAFPSHLQRAHQRTPPHPRAATAQRILTDPPPAFAALNADDLTALTRIFAALNSAPERTNTDQTTSR